MMYFRGDSNSSPVYEGIDKIKIMLQPHMVCFLDSTKIIGTKHKRREIWYRTGNNFLGFYVKYSKFQQYLYFIIHGEYIDLHKNINEVIIDAFHDLFRYGTINANQYLQNIADKSKNMIKLPEYCLAISRDFISNHLHFIVRNVKELELFFDMPDSSIYIKNHTYIFNAQDPQFHNKLRDFHTSGEYRKESAIIVKEGTIYSKDYHYKRRPSTIKLYNRKEKQIRYNNAYTHDKIDAYPFDMRLEILLTNSNTGNRLNMANLNGTYEEIMYKYAGLLRVYFTRYIHNIQIENTPHLVYFPRLYEYAKQNPHKRYTGSELSRFIPKYPSKNQIAVNSLHFQYILDGEYKKIRNDYLYQINALRKIMMKDFRMDLDNACYYMAKELCDYNSDEYLNIGDEYMPIKL